MSTTLVTSVAFCAFLLSTLSLQHFSHPNQAIFSDCICWCLILLCGTLYKYRAKWPLRPFNLSGLHTIALGGTLLCLSESIPGKTWSLAPLLSLILPIVQSRSYVLLGQEPTEQKESPANTFNRKQILLFLAYGGITAGALLRGGFLSVLPVNLCWLLAQLAIFVGIFEKTKSWGDGQAEYLVDAFSTLSDLAVLMACTTVPLSLLWWAKVTINTALVVAGVSKALYWGAMLALTYESKISVPIWSIIFSICTNTLWRYDSDWRMVVTLVASFVALYQISTAFARGSAAKWITIALALYPIWAIASHQDLSAHLSRLSDASEELQQSTFSQHPIQELVSAARESFERTVKRQSRSLEEAVVEYTRRHGRSPPPGFDEWYQFTVDNNVQLPDEYDLLTTSLEPFWQVSPRILRDYVDQAVAIPGSNFNTLVIKDHKASLSRGSFQHMHLLRLLEPVMQYLPDIKAALNEHDEPRVVIPHDQLSKPLASTGNSEAHINSIYFGLQDQQRVWETITLSCPPDSLARSDLISSTPSEPITELPFVSDLKESQDICKWPSSASTKHGFLSSPSSFHYTHHRVPVLGTAKFSTFQDILIPSAYYFQPDIAAYNEAKDTPFEKKKDSVYWRGSATGGHWSGGSWKMGHRQRFVNYTNNADQEITLLEKSKTPNEWTSYTAKMSKMLDKFLVKFSQYIQCDEADCKEQSDFFKTAPKDGNDDASNYKVLYNIDGNSFSGRYYRFLKSNSLVFMQALFKEWHDDRILPWVHFVPISNSMEELPEITRYLLEEPEGKVIAKRIADESREWSRKTLRSVDMSAAYFRLLIEYHRLLSDDRDKVS